MKFLAFSDLHLNNLLPHATIPPSSPSGVSDRLLDQKRVLSRIRKDALKYGVRAILALGDVFDKNRVDAVTASEGLSSLAKLADTKKSLFMRGNHECQRRDGGRDFLETVKSIGCDYLEDGQVVIFHDHDGPKVAFHSLGFCDQKRAREWLARMAERRDSEFKDCTNVLLLHHSIMGCTAEGGWVCDDGLGADEVTEGWDWTFSGHFHPSQAFGREDRGMYLGSTMQLDYGDAGRACGYWLIEFDKKGNCNRTFIDSSAPRFFEGEHGDAPDWGDESPDWMAGVRKGDFIRRIFRATRDDWRTALQVQAENWKKSHRGVGYRADYIYKPIARHSAARFPVSSLTPGLSKKRMSPGDCLEDYLTSPLIEKGDLDVKSLRAVGRRLIEGLESSSSHAAIGATVELKSVTLSDFGAIGKAKLKLRKSGLVWVSGENCDSDAASSNGSAKTTLFRGLTWGLFGETTDSKGRDEIIRKDAKIATVRIALTNDHVIERTRRRGSEKVRLLSGGADVSGENVQESINRVLGMNFNLWRNTVFYAQDDDKRFLRSNDSKRKDIMYDLLGLHFYRFAYEAAKRERALHRSDADKSEKELEKLAAAGQELDLEGLKEDVEDWERKREARALELLDEAKEALESAKKAFSRIDRSGDLEIAKERFKWAQVAQVLIVQHRAIVRRRQAFALEELGEARNERAKYKTELRLKTEALAGLAGTEKCPVCSSDLAAGDAAKHVKELKRAVATLETKAKRAISLEAIKQSVFDATDSELKLVDMRRERVERLVAESETALEVVRVELERAEDADEIAKDARYLARKAVKKAREARVETNPYTKRYLAARARAQEIINSANELKQVQALALKQAAYANFWMDGFGPQGIPSWLLDDTMPELTRRANEYLEKLADGDINMEFDAQRELKATKGEFRDEISVSWVIEGNGQVLPSGGQWRKMELATDFALMDIVADRAGISPKIMILDEALDGLDPEGRSRVVSLLAELRARRESIFVISHSEGMSEIFERELVVTKSGGVATIRELA